MIKVSNFDSMCAEKGLFIKGNILSFSIIQNRSVKLLPLVETLLAVILQQFKNEKINGIKLSTGVSLVDVLTQ